jgi:hypothetical protein
VYKIQNLRRSLTLLVRTRGDDSNGLALDVWHLTTVVHDHVAGFPVHQWRLAGDGLLADAAALVRSLRAEEVPRDLL